MNTEFFWRFLVLCKCKDIVLFHRPDFKGCFMNNQQRKLFEYFDALGITHTTYHHQPLFTCADCPEIEIPAPETKNLFLKDDKKRLWLVSALQSTVINLKALSKILDAKGLRFAQAELLREYLGVEPGSVTWFALINDAQKMVNPILDSNILKNEIAAFHPLKNDATTVISTIDLLTFTKSLGYTYRVLDF